jgi:hypothetical protein
LVTRQLEDDSIGFAQVDFVFRALGELWQVLRLPNGVRARGDPGEQLRYLARGEAIWVRSENLWICCRASEKETDRGEA